MRPQANHDSLVFDPTTAEADLVTLPEKMQTTLVLITLVCIGVACAATTILGMDVASIVVIAGGCLLLLPVSRVLKCSPRLQTRVTVYPNGLFFNIKGKTYCVAYEKIESVWYVQKHHYEPVLGKPVYLGTLLEFELVVEGQFRTIRFDAEFRQGQKSEKAVELLCNRCNELVFNRLRAELESNQFVPWGSKHRLTLDGLQVINELGTVEKEIDFDEIDRWDVQDGFVRVWKKDSGFPCLEVSVRAPNTIPLYSLMRTLYMVYRHGEKCIVSDETWLPPEQTANLATSPV